MSGFADQLSDLVVRHAGEWWTYATTTGLCWLDGFFPPLPSESVVIAMASLSHTGSVALVLLAVCALVGAWLGDSSAYWIGRRLRLDRLFRGRRGRATLARAHDLLQRKGAVVLLVARFIPGVRVAMNMTAGTLRYPVRRFMALTAISSVIWTTQAILIGLLAGRLFQDSPLLGIVVGVVLGLLVGVLIERVHSWWERHHAGSEESDGTSF